eukprot:NODE_423_length_2261_cov_42.810216_g394_i0.p1 GENE.NODE_423_length_2261_cov_42.810216_g394_i0~~NODE_423_length_2261_cov_42.810216_g394_i0.p1  ORF type:complete len:737 (-),score=126.96 NODE_423_length_2261_cov_42.810216_g394_i0:50-2191(-)
MIPNEEEALGSAIISSNDVSIASSCRTEDDFGNIIKRSLELLNDSEFQKQFTPFDPWVVAAALKDQDVTTIQMFAKCCIEKRRLMLRLQTDFTVPDCPPSESKEPIPAERCPSSGATDSAWANPFVIARSHLVEAVNMDPQNHKSLLTEIEFSALATAAPSLGLLLHTTQSEPFLTPTLQHLALEAVVEQGAVHSWDGVEKRWVLHVPSPTKKKSAATKLLSLQRSQDGILHYCASTPRLGLYGSKTFANHGISASVSVTDETPSPSLSQPNADALQSTPPGIEALCSNVNKTASSPLAPTHVHTAETLRTDVSGKSPSLLSISSMPSPIQTGIESAPSASLPRAPSNASSQSLPPPSALLPNRVPDPASEQLTLPNPAPISDPPGSTLVSTEAPAGVKSKKRRNVSSGRPTAIKALQEKQRQQRTEKMQRKEAQLRLQQQEAELELAERKQRNMEHKRLELEREARRKTQLESETRQAAEAMVKQSEAEKEVQLQRVERSKRMKAELNERTVERQAAKLARQQHRQELQQRQMQEEASKQRQREETRHKKREALLQTAKEQMPTSPPLTEGTAHTFPSGAVRPAMRKRSGTKPRLTLNPDSHQQFVANAFSKLTPPVCPDGLPGEGDDPLFWPAMQPGRIRSNRVIDPPLVPHLDTRPTSLPDVPLKSRHLSIANPRVATTDGIATRKPKERAQVIAESKVPFLPLINTRRP